MIDRTELMESALDSLPEGVALLGMEGEVLFWNQAAEAITGYANVDVLSRPVPDALEPLLPDGDGNLEPAGGPQHFAGPARGRGARVHALHKLGHLIHVIERTMVLRDGMGERIGKAIVFHPADSLDALPRGEAAESRDDTAGRTDLEVRLQAQFEDFVQGGQSFGVMWITVDQAQVLRKTHGAKACEAMLEKLERALAQGLRPADELGRWGDDEFLILSHERTPEMLAVHAQLLAGMARTADFRWWGDRASLTVSIGAAQADAAETLAQLLERAQEAMVSSIHAGGNHITSSPRRLACSPS
jgi:diguanylate cyclase (GGDEF)-like protein/PAS domain S-box-containing protein